MRFKFNPQNRFSHLADGFLFAYLENPASETWINLLGYCHRAEVKPYLRDDGHKLFVRADSLARDGILKPVSQLKESRNG